MRPSDSGGSPDGTGSGRVPPMGRRGRCDMEPSIPGKTRGDQLSLMPRGGLTDTGWSDWASWPSVLSPMPASSACGGAGVADGGKATGSGSSDPQRPWIAAESRGAGGGRDVPSRFRGCPHSSNMRRVTVDPVTGWVDYPPDMADSWSQEEMYRHRNVNTWEGDEPGHASTGSPGRDVTAQHRERNSRKHGTGSNTNHGPSQRTFSPNKPRANPSKTEREVAKAREKG